MFFYREDQQKSLAAQLGGDETRARQALAERDKILRSQSVLSDSESNSESSSSEASDSDYDVNETALGKRSAGKAHHDLTQLWCEASQKR